MSTTKRHASGVEETDPDTFTTVMVGVIGSLLVVIAVVFLQGLYDRVERAELRRKVVEETPLELQTLHVRQQEKLAATAWVDPAAGVVSIPIGRAMDLVVHDPALKAVPPPEPPPAPAPQATPPAAKP
jgi:hypothetical protein